MARWTRDEAVAAVQRFAQEHGHAPTARVAGTRSGLPSYDKAAKLFGGWPAMLEAAGLDPGPRPVRPPRAPWTHEQACAKLRAFEDRVGRTPQLKDARDPSSDLPSGATIHKLFGTWNAARKAAGCSPGRTTAGTAHHQMPRFEIAEVAAGLPLDAHEQARLARMVASIERVTYDDGLDAVQDAWIAFARHGHGFSGDGSGALGWVFVSARKAARSTARKLRASIGFEPLERDTASDPDALLDQVGARLDLAFLVERCQPGDDVLHVVADQDRAALNLYEPIAQQRRVDPLDRLPAGRWLEKLRAARDAGHITCVCWEHVREFGITPPPEVAHHFPDCMGQRHGTLKRRVENAYSPMMQKILAAVEAPGREAVAA